MKVIKLLDDDNYVINAGAIDGVTASDKYVIYVNGERVIDPDTGKDLGLLEMPKARCNVIHVQDQMTIIRSFAAKPKGGMSGIVMSYEVLSGIAGDSSPYNLLSAKDRVVKVGDLVRKVPE